jgi:acyl CoA:acetate/3-ketoacid CoA transferase beta subunit
MLVATTFSDEKIISPQTGLPVAVVSPRTVKCLLVVETICFGVVPLAQTNFSSP